MIFLNLVLIILIAYILIKSHNNKVQSEELFKQQKIIQVKTNAQVEDWNAKVQILKDELKRQNEMIVLEGRREIKATYDSTKDEVKYQGKDNKIRWVFDKLNELKTKSISVQSVYIYTFTYSLANLDVEAIDNTLHIKIYRNDIHLKPIAEDSSQRIISDETRILSGKFTPQQISSIMYVTQMNTYNNIVNDNNLHSTALMNTKTNIEELSKKFGIKSVEFEIVNTESAENDEVEVINDSN